MKKICTEYWPISILLLLSGLVVWPTFLPGYFFHHDDLQVMRIFEMRRCFADLQIPCRWVPDMGFGNGFPLFNYYSVLPYYIGALLSYILGYLGAAKALFSIPLVLGGIFMYLLGKELWGRIPGFLVGLLYLFAPYKALDAYVRGAVAESFALSLIPLVFYSFLKLIKDKQPIFKIITPLSLAAFLLSHNLMTMMFLPVLLVWVGYFLYQEKFVHFKAALLSFVLGIGLASFFIIPAYFEQNLVQINTLFTGSMDFRGHYATAYQLFLDRSWEYGSSIFGPQDTISFQLGWPYWWLAVLALPVTLYLYKKRYPQLILWVIVIALFWGAAFMVHERSLFVWEKLTPLRFMQFPWRFLSLAIFSSSLIGGMLLGLLKGKWQLLTLVVVGGLTITLNWAYFKPKDFYPWMKDEDKLVGTLWEIQQQAGILDYLPRSSEEPKGPRPERPEVISGKAKVGVFFNRTNNFHFDLEVVQNANIEIPVFDFPNWQVNVNGQPFSHSRENRLGRIRLDLPPGDYQIEGWLHNTLVRTIANIISLISGLAIIYLFYYEKIKRAHR